MVSQDFRPSGGPPGEAAGNAGGGAPRRGGDLAPPPPPSQAREREGRAPQRGLCWRRRPSTSRPRARAGCVRRGNSFGTESRVFGRMCVRLTS